MERSAEEVWKISLRVPLCFSPLLCVEKRVSVHPFRQGRFRRAIHVVKEDAAARVGRADAHRLRAVLAVGIDAAFHKLRESVSPSPPVT
jgi:hypothetical protein